MEKKRKKKSLPSPLLVPRLGRERRGSFQKVKSTHIYIYGVGRGKTARNVHSFFRLVIPSCDCNITTSVVLRPTVELAAAVENFS